MNLFKGGQGRSDQDVEDVSEAFCAVVVAGIAILGVWLVWLAL